MKLGDKVIVMVDNHTVIAGYIRSIVRKNNQETYNIVYKNNDGDLDELKSLTRSNICNILYNDIKFLYDNKINMFIDFID